MIKSHKVFLVFLLAINFVENKAPEFLQKCSVGNKKCLLDNINKIFSSKYAGDPAFGLIALDPVDLNLIEIKANAKSPIKVNLKLTNTKLFGAKNMTAIKFKGFEKSPIGRHIVLLESPMLTILADYQVSGQVMIIPISGEGRANLTMIQPKLKISIEGAEKQQNDELFMDVKSTALDMDCEKIEMDFTNLFNSDQVLNEHFSEFINGNWRDMFQDLKNPFLSEINKTLFFAIKQVFDKTPYTDMFAN